MANTYKFKLVPLNENQELNYQEPFIGNAQSLALKCRTMVDGLSVTLTHGWFTIKIENQDCTKHIFWDPIQGFLDEEDNPIPRNSKAANIFIKQLVS